MTLGNTTRNRFFACCLLALAALAFTANAWAQLSGTKTIGGASPDYPTIKAAILDLNAQGVAAPGVTFLIRSGTYNEDSLRIRTSTSSASAPIVFKPDVGATVVINVTPPSTAYDFAIKIDTTQYVTINGSNSGTTSRDLTINSLGTSGQRGIWVSGASHYATIKNCNINVGAGIATPTSSVIGIDFRYTGAAQNPNYVLAENNLIRYAYTGIRIEGYLTGDVCESPVFRNNIIDSVANAGIFSFYFNDGRFYNNDINIKRGSSATIYGIYIGSVSARARVYNNKVHDINQLSTSSTTYGIYSSGTSTLASHAIFNNFVWGISSPATATGAIYGIYDGTGNSAIADTIAFNTVVLTGSSTGNKTTAAFYKGSSTGPAYVYNNIFHNTRTDGTTGVAVAIYKVSTTTVLNSNFNNLYVGTPDAQHNTGRISSTNYATLADWRTANSSDAASFAENSPFVSSTDLHIQTTVPTQLESGGTPVAAITTDIDGDSRNATTPDVGADEFAGIGLDLTPPVITYTPLTNTGQTTARTLIATITDASGVPTSGIGLPRVYWRINSGAYTGVAGTFVSGNQYSFTFGAGVADGDTVSYFVAAQDNASPPNVSVFPSQGASGLTANPPAASTPPTNPSRYIVRQPLAGGDYTVGLTLFERVTGTKLTPKSFTRRVLREVPVGPEIDHKALGPTTTASITPYQRTELREVEETYSVLMDGDKPYQGPTRVMLNDALRERFGISSRVLAVYPTITAAVNDLNVRGVAGAIRFLLVDTLYTSETLPIVVQVNNDSVPTASKTVTIKPNTGVTATISGALASGPVFRILTSYIIIDGSNTTGGTTRNLTIQNTSATSPQVVVFGSLGTTPITNGTLMNCHIINGALTSTPVIISDGTTAGSPGYFSNITIKNNHIRKAYIGVYANGGAAPTQNGSNLVYESNIFTPVGADSMRYIGLYMQGVNGATVRGNEMGFFSGVSSEDDKGIWLASGTTNAVVERNYIHDLVYFGTGGYGGHGIYVSSVMTNANNVLRNNMIANMAGDGWNYASIPTDNPIGIVFSGTQTGNSAYYNSIHLFGNRLNQTDALSMGIYLGAGSEANIVNNNIINKLGFLASTGYGATGIYAVTSNTQFTNINYNNYFSDAPSPALNIIGKIGASDYTTLAAWRAASGGDTNSVSGAVNFVSPTDLHIVSYLPSLLDSAATPIAGITTDFDGETRNATRPDIGADEFTRVALPPPVISNIVRSTRVPLAGDTVVVTCTITDTLGISSANLIYNVNDTVNSAPMTLTGGTPQNGTWRGVVPGSANQNGNRVELQIQANSTSGQSTTTPKAAARSYYAGISPLSLTGLRRMHPNGRIMDSLYYARVTGTVNGPNFQTTNLGYHFQDAVGGIQLFSFGITRPPLNRGDSIIVVGRIAQFRGLTEIVPDTQTTDIQVVDTGRTVTPIEVTVAAFNANPELYESRLLRMVTLQRRDPTPPWPGPGTSANIVMYQNVVTDTIIMRIDSDTEIPGSPEPTYPVTVTGVITQFSSSSSVYNNGYQTQPRYLTDLVSAPSPLSGTYTVGTGGAFPTLDSAFSALATRGVSGPVTFSLIDSLYRPTRQLSEQDLAALDVPRTVDMITDDGQVVTINPFEARGDKPLDIVGINLTGPIPGASATNRVTLRPANNVRARIVGTGPATFNFRNVSYVTFDGVGTTGPTQLAIENTAANGIAIALVGNSDNNIVQNLTLRAPYASGIGVYLDTASVAAGDSNLITGNNVPVAYFGVYVRGGNYVARGNRITNNVFGADSLGALGVYNQQVNGSVIANNLIQNVKDAVAAGGNIAGIWIATRQLNLRVYNNVVAGVSNRPGATGAVFASGIYCFGTSTDTTRSLFYNNMVYGLDNPTTSASGTIRGMYLSTGRNDTAAYNTVRLTGTDAGSIISGALYLSSAAANVTLLNNIAVNERVTTGTGRALGLYLIAAPAGLLTNYNDLYVPAQTGSHVAAVGTTNYTTLAQWQATGRDSQSVSVMPNFQAPHLHINPTIPTVLDGGAKRIASITTDIDGQTRHPLRPDIGADEFAPASFFDNFEAYNVGQQLACQNPVDWTTWSLSPCNATEDPFISSAFAYSGTKSVVIVQNNDLVKRVTADTTGVYSMTFRFYIPRTKAGYFNTLAVFTPPSTFNWGMEVYFDSTGNGRLFAGSATAFPFTFTRDAWQLARVVVDLTRDSAKFYINSTLVRTWRWTAGASGGGSPRRLAANDFYGATAWDQMYMDDYDFRPDTWTGVEETPVAVPETFSLMQNYPNPFNPATTIRYALPKEAQVRVQVYNILGQLVAELVNDVQNAGYHNIVWNGRNQYGTQVATGVYLYRLEARPTDGGAPFVSTKKMLLVK